MDNRRTLTRGRQKDPKDVKETKKPETKKNSVRTSPSRKASPSRRASPPAATGKSPSRRASPGRRASPSRRVSPSRRASPPPRPASTTSTRSSRQRSAAVITPIPVNIPPPSPIKEKKEPPTAETASKVTIDKINITSNNESVRKSAITTTTTTSSVHSSFSISTHKTADIGASKNTSGESEVAKLTDFIRRSVSKAFSTSNRGGSQTPSTHTSQISRSVSRSAYDDGDPYTKMEFSDSEEENFKSVNISTNKSSYLPLLETSICRKLEVPKEFGGLLGASILLILIPALSYYLPWCCRKTACKFKQPNLQSLLDMKYLEKVFNGQAVGSYVAFSSGVFVLSAALFGRFVRLPSDRLGDGYRFNALPIAFLATVGLGVGEYLNYTVVDFILRNYLRYCLFSVLNALLGAGWCYIRSNYLAAQDLQLNPYAKSGNFIVDFCLGKHVNPKWFGKVEIKQVYYKISLIFTLVLAQAYLLKNIQVPIVPAEAFAETQTWVGNLTVLAMYYGENIKFDTVSLISTLMLLIYALDGVIFEHHLASSFDLQQEGVGALLLLRYAATPFILNSVPKFLFEHKSVVMPNWALITMVVAFVAGLVLKRISNRTKYQYRINPNHPNFANVETVHTFQGRRLLLGNLWGCVRQPNYAGEILVLLSFTLPLCFKFAWPPLVSVLLLVIFLLHRAQRVSNRNSARYHSSYVRYCMKVRNLVVPKIF